MHWLRVIKELQTWPGIIGFFVFLCMPSLCTTPLRLLLSCPSKFTSTALIPVNRQLRAASSYWHSSSFNTSIVWTCNQEEKDHMVVRYGKLQERRGERERERDWIQFTAQGSNHRDQIQNWSSNCKLTHHISQMGHCWSTDQLAETSHDIPAHLCQQASNTQLKVQGTTLNPKPYNFFFLNPKTRKLPFFALSCF